MHAAVLRYFVAVARAGSIRKASDELHVASSAVSRQIQKLEDELGTPLFERLPNGLRLTQAGEVTLRHAKATLHDFDLLTSELGALKGKKTGLVTLAALDSLFVRFLPEQIMAFHRQHPAVNFRVHSGVQSRIAMMVAEGEIDFGITFNLPHPEDTEFVADVPMPLMAMVARDHPLARLDSVSLSECAQYNLLLQVDTEPLRSLIEVELSSLERTGRTLVTSNNLLLLRPMVEAGLGVAFYTPLGMVDQMAAGTIVGVPLKGSRLDGLRLGLVVPRRRQLTQAAQALADQLGAALTELGRTWAGADGR
ncbi:MAG: transcriptional regulator [Alphaproteobacteria bacterium]|nr:MAG: transcriptional regulator [Alphaproteobacteria bacterium]